MFFRMLKFSHDKASRGISFFQGCQFLTYFVRLQPVFCIKKEGITPQIWSFHTLYFYRLLLILARLVLNPNFLPNSKSSNSISTGGEIEIRTLAGIAPPDGFQDRSLEPLGYFSICLYMDSTLFQQIINKSEQCFLLIQLLEMVFKTRLFKRTCFFYRQVFQKCIKIAQGLYIYKKSDTFVPLIFS